MMQSHLDFALATPEILLLVLGLAILLIDAVSSHPERKTTFVLTLATLAALTVVSLLQWRDGVEGQTFNGLYVTDSLAHLLKVASYIAVAATLVYGRIYAQQRDMMQRGGELYVLTLFALLGQMVMISAGNLISIYLGLASSPAIRSRCRCTMPFIGGATIRGRWWPPCATRCCCRSTSPRLAGCPERALRGTPRLRYL
ncbi:hypothetical protein AZ15_4034 [Bordetella bronchiseptica A1-7]|nr:hypothetical protein AZ15_4034 [Bordetella bronchiseptica A1-7]